MKVLLLSPYPEKLRDIIFSRDELVEWSGKITLEKALSMEAEFIICFGYAHLLAPDIVKSYRGRAINLHISFLPYNKSSHPNFWSFVEDTPQGVTIHLVDEGADSGDIICQKQLHMDRKMTFRETYDILIEEIVNLFRNRWGSIRSRDYEPIPQPAEGTFHMDKDFDPYRHFLSNGWDTVIEDALSQIKGAK